MILCDTNIFIEVFRNRPYMETILIDIDNILVSDVIKAELFCGARDKNELQYIENHMSNFLSLSIHPEISKMAVEIVKNYCLSQKLKFPDALIAATAIYNDIELFTLNVKDFKFIPNLKLYQIRSEKQ